MDPSNFEELLVELLRRMGFRAERTGRTGDGGVDCEAYDDRPVVGGKIIVQAKRYSSTVAPSVVRDLFGTVHAKGATKGVLITTSGFGPESRAFAQDKPLELIDGMALEALLTQYDLVAKASVLAWTQSLEESGQELPPISPDGQYYWSGSAWQSIYD
jgi:restriction system protein